MFESLLPSTIGIILLLLPGFAALMGKASTERFSRTQVQQGPVAQFAIIVFVAFVVHCGFLLIIKWTCEPTPFVRCVDYGFFLGGSASAASVVVESSILHTALYMLAALFAGVWSGRLFGELFSRGVGRTVAQHKWVHDLDSRRWGSSASGLVTLIRALRSRWRSAQPARLLRQARQFLLYHEDDSEVAHAYFANVLARIPGAKSGALYRGRLNDFGVNQDGSLAYLVMEEPSRTSFPTRLNAGILDSKWHRIGSSGGLADDGVPTLLYIESPAIENVVFTSQAFYPKPRPEDVEATQETLTRELESSIAGEEVGQDTDDGDSYEVLSRRNVDYGTVARQDVRVRVASHPSRDTIANIARQIVDSAPNTSMMIHFYLPDDDPTGEAQVATVTWAPGGEWSRAGEDSEFDMRIDYMEPRAGTTTILRPSGERGILEVPLPEGAQLEREKRPDDRALDLAQHYRIDAGREDILTFFDSSLVGEGWKRTGPRSRRINNIRFFTKHGTLLAVIAKTTGGFALLANIKQESV